MATQINAYRSDTGKIFSTREEASMDEIRDAADTVAALAKEHLINVATGRSTCASTRAAILRLADEIRQAPLAGPDIQ